jgi:hypothetical protein
MHRTALALLLLDAPLPALAQSVPVGGTCGDRLYSENWRVITGREGLRTYAVDLRNPTRLPVTVTVTTSGPGSVVNGPQTIAPLSRQTFALFRTEQTMPQSSVQAAARIICN